MTAFVFSSWLPEKPPFAPYLAALGHTELWEANGVAHSELIGPQQVCDVNLHEEAQIAAVALRRAQNTRSELWSVGAHASLYIRLAASAREGQRPVASLVAILIDLLCTMSGSFASRGPIPLPAKHVPATMLPFPRGQRIPFLCACPPERRLGSAEPGPRDVSHRQFHSEEPKRGRRVGDAVLFFPMQMSQVGIGLVGTPSTS